jgi:hypothetical protein
MKYRACMVMIAVIAVVGCSGGDGIVTVNNPPTIEFTFAPIGVPTSVPVVLTVDVSDPDEDDNLTVSWDITTGAASLTPQNSQKTEMEWDVPDTPEADTVTVTVSDGEDSRSVTAVLKVGTLRVTSAGSFPLSGSPYILRPSTSPPKWVVDGTTTIAAGTELLIDLPSTALYVLGTFNIQGTPSNPVVIRPNDRTVQCGLDGDWWEGILATSDGLGHNGVVNASNMDLSYATDGVALQYTGVATISESSIRCSYNSGVLHQGIGALVVTDTEIRGGQNHGIMVDKPLLSQPQAITITGCDVKINGQAGLWIDMDDQSAGTPIVIRDNKFEFNSFAGIFMRHWAWPTIENNAFVSNGGGSYNIRLADFHSTSSPDTLDATCNYWGASVSNESTILNSVYDRRKSATVGTFVVVKPWLNEDPFGLPDPPPCTGGVAR